MKQNKCTWGTLAASIFVCGLAASTGHAQSTDALLNKLVSKGVLTADEAKELKKDTTAAPAADSRLNLPAWLNNIKIYGDFRGRYDGTFQNKDNFATDPLLPLANQNINANTDRNRLRYRLRLGLTANMTDHFEMGMRLASGEVGTVAGNGSAFSANTTLNNDAGRKPIFVDLAYGKWSPTKWAQAEIGKMNNAFWFTDMVMDPDYNPEGGQQKFTYDLNDKHRFSWTAGEWAIQENFNAQGTNVNHDVYLFVNQLDWTAKWAPQLSSRVGVAIMNFKNQHDISTALDDVSFGTRGGGFINQNGTAASGPTSPNFNPIIARGEVTYTLDSFPGFAGGFPITAGAEYANNPGAGSHVNEAYNFGVTFGSARNRGNWQLSYNYKNIETASVWHGLNDDDFGFNGRGGTDVRGHQVIASYHPYDPLTVNLRFMRTEQISNNVGEKSEQDRIFFDLIWAF